jgi:hypothetical protein
VASRLAVDALIEAGRVTIDGRPATLGERIDPAACQVAIDGRPVDLAAALAVPPVHLALHKPVGVTSTVADRHAERTVLDLVPPGAVMAGAASTGGSPRPIGGLILLTNDGEWVNASSTRATAWARYAVGIAVASTWSSAASPGTTPGRPRGVRVAAAGHPDRDDGLGRLVAPALESGLARQGDLAQGPKRQARRMLGHRRAGRPPGPGRVGPVRLTCGLVRFDTWAPPKSADWRPPATALTHPPPSAAAPPARAPPGHRPAQGRPRTRR